MMKKLLALLGAASALLIATGVNAQTYSITMGGNVGATCTITSALAQTRTGVALTTNNVTATSASIGWGHNIVNTSGFISAAIADLVLSVSASSSCNYQLATTHGGQFVGTSSGRSIPYIVGIAQGGAGAASPSPYAQSGGGVIGTINISNTVQNTQTIDIAIGTQAGTIQYPTDQYSDTLVLTIVAS